MPEKDAKREIVPKLKPVIQINGLNYILMTTDIGALPRKTLGKNIVNIEGKYRQEIIESLDFLFQGF